MRRRPRYRRKPCPYCHAPITTNALGREAHFRGEVCGRQQDLNRFPGLVRSLDLLAFMVRVERRRAAVAAESKTENKGLDS